MRDSAHPALSGRTGGSLDHYLRLDLQRLTALSFRHLESEADPDGTAGAALDGCEGACMAREIGGYTEWLDAEGDGYSVGWDWFVRLPQGSLAVTAHSIRTNIMLVNAAGIDQGRAKTEEELERWLGTWDWATTVLQALRLDAPQDPSKK